jgi:hypothetical protein
MDKTALVSIEIDVGERILEILDQAGIKVSVALWASLSEFDTWRMIMAAKEFDSGDDYRLLNSTVSAAGFPIYKMPPIMIFPMKDPFIRDLRRYFAKAQTTEGMRLGGQRFGDRFLEDGWVYRIK